MYFCKMCVFFLCRYFASFLDTVNNRLLFLCLWLYSYLISIIYFSTYHLFSSHHLLFTDFQSLKHYTQHHNLRRDQLFLPRLCKTTTTTPTMASYFGLDKIFKVFRIIKEHGGIRASLYQLYRWGKAYQYLKQSEQLRKISDLSRLCHNGLEFLDKIVEVLITIWDHRGTVALLYHLHWREKRLAGRERLPRKGCRYMLPNFKIYYELWCVGPKGGT